MNTVAKALNYLDDELIFSALKSIEVSAALAAGAAPRRRAGVRAPKLRGGAKAAAISTLAVAMCAVIAVWAALAFTGNHAEDPRAHGEQKILSSFEEIAAVYPDSDMAERISSLDFIEHGYEGVQLWYDVGGDWTDSGCWNSVVMVGEIAQTEQCVILYCLFDGTYDDWAVSRECYRTDAYYLTVGDTEVKIANQLLAHGETDSYAIFESGGAVYELVMCNYCGNADSGQYQRAILEAMLK